LRPRISRILDFREFPILYVDDEPENLRIFELTFRREFSVLTASSGEEALEVVHQQPVAMVLSDQKMPGMLGTELLRRVADLDPKMIRVLVTAYGDAETLSSAINSGSIYRYVPKPWSPGDMTTAIRRGIEVYALDRERDQLLRELTLLNRVAKSINQELDVRNLVDLLYMTITSDFGYDAASVLIKDDRSGRLAWADAISAAGMVSDEVKKIEVSDRTCPVFMNNLRDCKVQGFSFDDAANLESPIREWIVEISAGDFLVVPLVGGKGLLGAFAVDNRRGGARFGWEDRTLLEGLANQAVIALENARLVEDLRSTREQVLRFDRLGTLGTLAAGLAHEINNPLVSIHTFLSMAPSKRLEEDPEFWGDYHSLAASEVDRIRRLVETMRQLGRENIGDASRELTDVVELTNQVVVLVGREARKAGVQISVSSEVEAPKIVAVKDHLHQVLMNLLLNAIHATPSDGSVSVHISLNQRLPGVCLEVRDSGEGIAEEDLERIFDPFFTTKGPDQGSGLGLMICHRIVADHQGTIAVESREGQGASFLVNLPFGDC
jgi:signal transduction histidine kinase/CheY-like chemotaxis protein